MIDEEKWRWRFLGYESAEEGQPVQMWFNGLRIEAQEEIVDLLQKLQVVTNKLWRRPEFDPLEGAGGISEIRPDNVRCVEGSFTYRIYGFFGPSQREYTFLHGTEKTVNNDRRGKRIAKERLTRIQRREASTHEFDFEGGLNPAIKKGPRSTGKVYRFPSK